MRNEYRSTHLSIASLALSAWFLVASVGCSPSSPGGSNGSGTIVWKAQSLSVYKAGLAVRDITPDASLIDSGQINLAGYAQRNKAAIGVIDPISVRAVVLQDALGEKVVLIALDVLAIRPEFSAAIRWALSQSLGVSDERILINVSHTHNAPVCRDFCVFPDGDQIPNGEYMRFLKNQVIQAAQAANDSLESVFIYSGTGKTDIGANRHSGLTYYDSTVDVLSIRRSDGSTKGTLFFHGCHPVKGGPLLQISADYPGAARAQLEADLGGTAVFFQGFGGDVNPSHAAPDFRSLGRRLAHQVEDVLNSDGLQPLHGAIDAKHLTLTLKLDTPAIPPDSTDASRQRWITLMQDPVAAAPAEVTELQTIRIGDDDGGWRIAASSHEVVGEWAPWVRSRWPTDHVVVMGYSNSVLSYLPNAKILGMSTLLTFPDKQNYEGSDSFEWYGLRGPLDRSVDQVYLAGWSSLASPDGGGAPETSRTYVDESVEEGEHACPGQAASDTVSHADHLADDDEISQVE
jgi:hypothetical protein